jgi:hypothetical protein
MTDLERAALLWLRVFLQNPHQRISAEKVEIYGVSRRRSRDIVRTLKEKGAISLRTSIGYGSRYVVDEAVAKSLLIGLDADGTPKKTSGW